MKTSSSATSSTTDVQLDAARHIDAEDVARDRPRRIDAEAVEHGAEGVDAERADERDDERAEQPVERRTGSIGSLKT